MKNYNSNEIQSLKGTIQSNIELINNSINWVNKNLKYDSKNNLNLKFKNTINTLNKINSNIDSKPVIAVFGASQVGKSYLIKNLLSEENTPFYITNGGKKYDFLKDINPPGNGAESTGVVTRFTVDNEVKYDTFPIKVKLLSPKDIFAIIVDTFYLDIKKTNKLPDQNALEEHLLKYESLANSGENTQSYFTEFDILELKEYIENHTHKDNSAILFSRFFERIGAIINKIQPEYWIDVLEIVWAKNQHLTKLAKELIKTAEKVNFSNQIYLKFNEVLRVGNEILDVDRIHEFYTATKETTVKLDSGDEITINVSKIAALIEELVFNIPKEFTTKKEFLNNSDLLDFPGARSREAYEDVDIIEEVIPKMYLRGKVSYLFNKYSDDFNINNLLFCTNDTQLQVNELPYLLEKWVKNNIGDTSYQRSKSLVNTEIAPLFVVFTFFNNQLKFDTTNDIDFENKPGKLNEKWDTRFNTFFENEIVTQTRDWHKNWTNQYPLFNNFYLLRDFKYSTDTYLGFEEFGKEIECNPLRKPYLKELENSFVNHSFVKKHFLDPKKSWDSSTAMNSNGSEFIISNLAKVSSNSSKIDRYINKHDELINEVLTELKNHYFMDDLSEVRLKNTKNVNNLFFTFNAILSKDINAFNHFISLLSLKSIDVYSHLHKNMHVDLGQVNSNELDESNILIVQFPELKTVNSLEEAIVILKKKLWLTSEDEVLSHLKEHNIDKNAFLKNVHIKSIGEYYVEILFEYWKSKLLKNDLEHFKVFINQGISKDNLHFLMEFYFKVFKQRNFKNKLIQIANNVSSEVELNRSIEEFLAETFTIIINEIVFNFDINYLNENELEEITKQNYSFSFINNAKTTNQSTIKELFDDSNEILDSNKIILGKYNKWIEYLRISLLINSGFADYDEVANNELKNLMAQYNLFENN